MKTTMIIALLVVAGIFISCGGSEMNCLEQCGMSFSKSNNKCRLDNAADNAAGIECSNLALKETHLCQGKCHGNI